jgi:hypothetical protein
LVKEEKVLVEVVSVSSVVNGRSCISFMVRQLFSFSEVDPGLV